MASFRSQSLLLAALALGLATSDAQAQSVLVRGTFNGIPLPALVSYEPGDGSFLVSRKSTYADYRNRLG